MMLCIPNYLSLGLQRSRSGHTRSASALLSVSVADLELATTRASMSLRSVLIRHKTLALAGSFPGVVGSSGLRVTYSLLIDTCMPLLACWSAARSARSAEPSRQRPCSGPLGKLRSLLRLGGFLRSPAHLCYYCLCAPVFRRLANRGYVKLGAHRRKVVPHEGVRPCHAPHTPRGPW